MSTVDTRTWSPDTDFNNAIEGIPLNADSSIAQTWMAVRALMAALKGDGDAIRVFLVPFTGATSQEDGTQGLVPAPEAGDENKVLRGDGTWGTVAAADHVHGNITSDGKLGTASRAVVTDGNRLVDVSSTTATEIGYLSGLSANAQNQIDARLLASEKITNSDIEAMMEA